MSNFDGFNMSGDFDNLTGAEIAALTAAATPIIAALGSIIKKGIDAKKGAQELKAVEDELKRQQEAFEAEEARKSAAQKKEEELAEKALNAQLDPIAQVQANPNLTPEEKAAAIADINESIGSNIPWKPILIISGIAVAAAGLYFFIKNRG